MKARSLQDFRKDSSAESDEDDDKLISTDFWEAYDPDEVFKTGFPLICSEPINVRALCFLCGSAGVEKVRNVVPVKVAKLMVPKRVGSRTIYE